MSGYARLCSPTLYCIVIPVKLGIIGVVNRSQEDIDSNKVRLSSVLLMCTVYALTLAGLNFGCAVTNHENENAKIAKTCNP